MTEPILEIRHRPVSIPVDHAALLGDLHIVAGSKGLVIFAHGSGSSRLSPRNRFVAHVLQKAGISTLLIDLLTVEEEQVDEKTSEFRFDIPMLSQRLAEVGQWAKIDPSLKGLSLGYFGASTGSAAALIAAAEHPDMIAAVVSRGGRPDLADQALSEVKAPVLLIVGERDTQVIELNRTALDFLNSESRLVIVPGATHLFEESGTLEQAAHHAAEWFAGHFQKQG
jgi:putative phosphoribosyl transferase